METGKDTLMISIWNWFIRADIVNPAIYRPVYPKSAAEAQGRYDIKAFIQVFMDFRPEKMRASCR